MKHFYQVKFFQMRISNSFWHLTRLSATSSPMFSSDIKRSFVPISNQLAHRRSSNSHPRPLVSSIQLKLKSWTVKISLPKTWTSRIPFKLVLPALKRLNWQQWPNGGLSMVWRRSRRWSTILTTDLASIQRWLQTGRDSRSEAFWLTLRGIIFLFLLSKLK